ncbi:030fd3c7-e9c1-47ee-8e06-0688f01c11d6 [Thermothielavioides terrestris]|uniref:030fd3c7-e9c1-47ee-8e06-0688f01c11d6 n=1 Tax=Thermothielavioides terrestris TaxID=2587410 RepID=A0A446BGV9_9PEZI|nr:030fd3c7-e9c1-47ee-8e06-0688f01c11d6 [Thermothielavioides terrestris]
MNAQVSFLEGTLSLIHIPVDLYPNLLQPILQVLLPPSQDTRQSITDGITVDNHKHGFLNISVTPIECSIVCNSAWAKSVFEPAIQRLPKDRAKTVAIAKDTYAALSVSGAGVDAGSRVADLTSPLAMANIPIFFITTYYSDFILVPDKDRQAVITTLLAKGFVFVEDDQSQLVSRDPSPTTTSHPHGFDFDPSHSRAPSQGGEPPSPHPSSVDDLQERTFALLRRRNVTPHIEPDLVLVHCTGIRGAGTQHPHHHPSASSITRSRGPNGSRRGSAKTIAGPAWVDTVDTKLYTGIVAALVAQPRFLSVSLAPDDNPPSLLLDRALLPLFGDTLVGPVDGALVPIFLDLADLPFEATGIVSGVAGRLVRQLRMEDGAELSYLSTARAGAVILSSEHAGVALGILGPLLGEGVD